jgi:2-keto-4-pentenoate hydratase
VLGHPAEAVAWLARTLSSFGEELRPGDVILPGAMARALPVGPGMRASAHIEGIGSVSVEFR